MLKGKLVYLRLFEPEDYEKTYKWHSDFDLMKSTVGPMRIISKEIERKWVLSKSENNREEIYLAICLVESDEMIGWYSISKIDHYNRKCIASGIVIGEKEYRNGDIYIEAGYLAFEYIINELNMNRVGAACLRENVMSRAEMESSFWHLEGVERQAVYKNGKYHDVCHYSILRDEYMQNKEKEGFGVFDDKVRRLSKAIKRIRQELKELESLK